MLSKFALKIYGLGLTVNYYLGFLPYKWDWSRQRVEFKEGKAFRVFWTAQVLFSFAFTVYETVRCFQTIYRVTNLNVRVIFIFVFAHNIFNLVATYTVYSSYGTLHGVINAFLEKNRIKTKVSYSGTMMWRREDEEEVKKTKSKKVASFIFPYVWLVLMYFFGSRLKIAILRPKLPILLTSMLKAPGKLPLPYKLLLYFPTVRLWLSPYCQNAFFINTILAYVFIMEPSILGMRRESKARVPSSGSLFVSEYIRNKVLQKYFNVNFTTWIIGLECFYICILTMRLFSLVVSPQLGALFQLAFPVMIFWLMFGKMAKIYENSTLVLESWKLCQKPPEFQRFHGAMQPMSVRLGTSFYIDAPLRLTVLSIVIDQAVSLIVGYNSGT